MQPRGPSRAHVVLDAHSLLPRIAGLTHHTHVTILWNERVGQIDTRRRLMVVSKIHRRRPETTVLTVPTARTWMVPDPSRISPIVGASTRVSVSDDGTAVELQHEIRQDHLPVRSRLDRRNCVVAITIEERDDRGCDVHAGRQVHFQRDPIARERHARGLEILVEAMRGRLRGHHQREDDRREKRRSSSPRRPWPRSRSSGRGRSCECDRYCCPPGPAGRTRSGRPAPESGNTRPCRWSSGPPTRSRFRRGPPGPPSSSPPRPRRQGCRPTHVRDPRASCAGPA